MRRWIDGPAAADAYSGGRARPHGLVGAGFKSGLLVSMEEQRGTPPRSSSSSWGPARPTVLGGLGSTPSEQEPKWTQ